MLNTSLLDKKKNYLLGVSGGPDSMALLDMMHEYSICVAHVNYNLRDDTEEDYKVVHDYCIAHSIPFYYKEFTPDDYVRGNFQSVARDMRYAFYQEVYKTEQCDALCLGHQKDDVIETIYMHLERDSHPDYLGIQEVSHRLGMTIIRPLLHVTKQDLRDYCDDHHILFHDDYTNFQTEFTRDRIRNTILNQYTDSQKEELLKKGEEYNKKQAIKKQEVDKFLTEPLDYTLVPKELLPDVLYALLKKHIEVSKISHHLIDEIIHQIQSSKPNIQMPIGVNEEFIKEYNNVYIRKSIKQVDYTYRIDHRQNFDCPYFKIRAQGELNDGIPVKDEDFPLTIRNMRPGDRMETAGGTKKVSRLFINAKIPSPLRRYWPVVLDCRGNILLVPGIAKNKEYLSINPDLFVIK